MADILLQKSNKLAHDVYRVSKIFPKDELFGLTSQLRRAALSVPVNLIEGFARQRKASYRQFLEIAYGSLRETKYLLRFAHEEGYISDDIFSALFSQANEVGRLIWSTLRTIKKQLMIAD